MSEEWQFDVVVIGAGVVGLSIAEKLSHFYENVLLVEKENSFGQHISSRNSEVIHSGIYYKKGSLKSKLCLEGNKLLYDFLQKYNIPHKRCGKLIVTSESKSNKLNKLYENGKSNGVENLQIDSKEELRKLEPSVKAEIGLLVPSAGILDSHSLMKKIEYVAKNNGVTFSYNTEISKIGKKENNYVLQFKGEEFVVKTGILVNSAGLWSDKISELLGINSEKNKYKLRYCKGNYFKTNKYKNMNHLIYPLPEEHSLGIHTRMFLDGSISFGPDVCFVDEINYKVDKQNISNFVKSINEYLDIKEEDLWEDYSGIRPKLVAGTDFIISNEKDNNFPNFINLIGVESPGLTSCFSIANHVKEIIL